jgi:hypothetical protein
MSSLALVSNKLNIIKTLLAFLFVYRDFQSNIQSIVPMLQLQGNEGELFIWNEVTEEAR